jgi:hypothetical protein
MTLRDAWEQRASDWVGWARSPELDRHLWASTWPSSFPSSRLRVA